MGLMQSHSSHTCMDLVLRHDKAVLHYTHGPDKRRVGEFTLLDGGCSSTLRLNKSKRSDDKGPMYSESFCPWNFRVKLT